MAQRIYRHILKVTRYLLPALLVISCIPAAGSDEGGQGVHDGEEGQILVVASYNPDTRRMSDFIRDFENKVVDYELPYDILVEDMGCKGMDEAHLWHGRLDRILARYDRNKLKAIVLLGQEAWASFLSQEDFPDDIPFFGCFVSENGIRLPDKPVGDDWMPRSVNMVEIAEKLGTCGGYINRYDLGRNIELIRSLYPHTTNIAFVSDNTYGGISLQSFVRVQAAEYPDFEFTFIDGRQPEEIIRQQVTNLPDRSVVLIGTWRVGRNGHYLMLSSVNDTFDLDGTIPVFTLSGTGFGNPAIGGYLPKYRNGALEITRQLKRYYDGDRYSILFSGFEGGYRFDRSKLDEFDIADYRLPHDSEIIDDNEARFRMYRKYIFLSLTGLVILACFATFLYILYHKNKALKDDLVERERQLIKARDRAEESDRLKSAFLANMSHEIRTPLNAIVGFSSLLKEELTNEERAEYSDIITSNSELMLALISDILDISRLETGKMQFNYTDVDVVGLCNQAIMSTNHLGKPGVVCSYVGKYKSFTISTDQQRLLQVLNNLLTNARKFTEHGSIEVDLEVLANEGMVRFSVTDTGTGIPEEKQSIVFNRFEKLDEFKQGTGLGLAICKQIVWLFGGEIKVDGSYTGGCRVVFTHPVKRPQQ